MGRRAAGQRGAETAGRRPHSSSLSKETLILGQSLRQCQTDYRVSGPDGLGCKGAGVGGGGPPHLTFPWE
jgi:hypothetical protein